MQRANQCSVAPGPPCATNELPAHGSSERLFRLSRRCSRSMASNNRPRIAVAGCAAPRWYLDTPENQPVPPHRHDSDHLRRSKVRTPRAPATPTAPARTLSLARPSVQLARNPLSATGATASPLVPSRISFYNLQLMRFSIHMVDPRFDHIRVLCVYDSCLVSSEKAHKRTVRVSIHVLDLFPNDRIYCSNIRTGFTMAHSCFHVGSERVYSSSSLGRLHITLPCLLDRNSCDTNSV